MMLRRTCVYDSPDQWEIPVRALTRFGRHFESLMRDADSVRNGFLQPVDESVVAGRPEYEPRTLHQNMVFGTPEEVIEKIERDRAAGVTHFLYGASFALDHRTAVRSLELFCERVMPHFRD